MAVEVKFIRVDDFDPTRCQTIGGMGQCHYKSIPNEQHCPMHSGGPLAAKQRKEAVRNYNISQWQNRINEFADNSNVKSLREEIGIARMMLENLLNICKTPMDILGYQGKISDLVSRIQGLVQSCHKLELQNSQLLDRTAVINISTTIVEVVGQFVQDEKVLDQIGNGIVMAIMRNHTEIKKSAG